MRRALVFLLFFSFVIPSICGAELPGFKKARLGTLSGQFLTNTGEPLPGGFIALFDSTSGVTPSLSGSFRIPDRLGKIDKDGRFSVKVLPGSYYMGAMINKDPGRGPGPPRKGEPFYFAINAEGSFRIFTLEMRETKDVGQVKSGLPGSFATPKDLATIEGKIFHEDGQPYENAMAMLKVHEGVLQKWDRPDFVSEKTDKSGHYIVHIPPGKYYVIARENIIGGRPQSGDSVGVYGRESSLLDIAANRAEKLVGSEDQLVSGEKGNELGLGFQGERIGAVQAGNEAVAVEVKAGEKLTGIDIIMYEVPDPVGTRKKFQEEGQKADDPAEFLAPMNDDGTK